MSGDPNAIRRAFMLLGCVLLLPIGALGQTQRLTHTCQFNKGPRAGQTIAYLTAQPILVGAPCSDGVASTGVAVPDNPNPQLTHTCKFDQGPRAGQTQVNSQSIPVGASCWDGVSSGGVTIPDKTSAPEPAKPLAQDSPSVVQQEQKQPTQLAVRQGGPSSALPAPIQEPQNEIRPALKSAVPPPFGSTAARANPSMDEILGPWQGVYFLYPQAMRVDLDLRRASSPAGESITGEFRFAPLVQEQRNFSGTLQGSYQISGQYDRPSRTLMIDPGQWIQRPNQPAVGLKMTGVFDGRTGIVAGTFSTPSNPNGAVLYFVLARPDGAAQALFAPTKRIWEEVQPNRPRPRVGINIGGGFGRPLGSGGEDIHKIANWAARLLSEYPKIDLQNTYTVAVPAQNLFEDRYFAANFGKTFDQLNEGELQKISQGLRSYLGERDGEKTALRQRYAFLQRYFEGFNVPAVFVGVLAQRVIRSWMDSTLAQVRSLAPDINSLFQIDGMEKATKIQIANLWPSERAAVGTEIAATRKQLAGQEVDLTAREVMRSADGYEGALALARWKLQQQNILQWLDSSGRESILTRISAQEDGILATLMAPEQKSLESIGQGSATSAKGQAWMGRFTERFTFAFGRPPVLAILRQAAELGVPEAELHLGVNYLNGIGFPRDYSSAANWLSKASTQGLPGAQLHLGILYQNGWGVARNLEKAKDLYAEAAKGKDPEIAGLANQRTKELTTLSAGDEFWAAVIFVVTAAVLLSDSRSSNSPKAGPGAPNRDPDPYSRNSDDWMLGALAIDSQSEQHKQHCGFESVSGMILNDGRAWTGGPGTRYACH